MSVTKLRRKKKRPVGRPRVYKNNAAKQKAYRQRKLKRATKSKIGKGQ